MNPSPTGRVTQVAPGRYDMTLVRTVGAPITDVWGSLTDPERTALWFGRWEGRPRPGQTVKVTMGFEEGGPASNLRIDECEPPRHLAVSLIDEAGEWNMEITLTQTHGSTRLELVQHLDDPEVCESSGPGWEYYLDMLLASRDSRPMPDFEDYYPSQASHFAAEARKARRR